MKELSGAMEIFYIWIIEGVTQLYTFVKTHWNHTLQIAEFTPGSSVDWARACKAKHCRFDSQSGHMPGLQARPPLGGTREAATHWCFSPSLLLSLTLSLKINKFFKIAEFILFVIILQWSLFQKKKIKAKGDRNSRSIQPDSETTLRLWKEISTSCFLNLGTCLREILGLAHSYQYCIFKSLRVMKRNGTWSRSNHPSVFRLACLCLIVVGQRQKWDIPAVVPLTSPQPISPWRTPATSWSPMGVLRPTIWRPARKWSGSAGWRPWNWPRPRLWRCWRNQVGSKEHYVWKTFHLLVLHTNPIFSLMVIELSTVS